MTTQYETIYSVMTRDLDRESTQAELTAEIARQAAEWRVYKARNKIVTITDIYAKHRPYTAAFVKAVYRECGLNISRVEIRRLASCSETAAEFIHHYNNHSFWMTKLPKAR